MAVFNKGGTMRRQTSEVKKTGAHHSTGFLMLLRKEEKYEKV
jgi:hypothetical protein